MEAESILLGIEKILDDWDPLGVLQDVKPISYMEGLQGEYTKYVEPIIEKYISNGNLKLFLIDLHTQLWQPPNEEMMSEINETTKKLNTYLSSQKRGDIIKVLQRKV